MPPPRRPLLQLPLELLYNIIEDDKISKKDLKNLRLVHPVLANALSPILFREVVFSFDNRIQVSVQLPADYDYEDLECVNKYNKLRKQAKDDTGKLRTPLVDRIAALKERNTYSQNFLQTVQSIVIDADVKSAYLDQFAYQFAKQRLGAKHFAEWFPNLKRVVFKAHINLNSKAITKLIRWIFRQKVDGVELVLLMKGFGDHRACMQAIKNADVLSLRGLVTKPSEFFKDISSAINASPSVSRLELYLSGNFGIQHPDNRWSYHSPFRLSDLFRNVSSDCLRNLKTLHLNMNVHSNDGHEVAKLRAVEELVLGSYDVTKRGSEQGGQREIAKKTIWSYMDKADIRPGKITVSMIDSSLLNYLITSSGRVTHLSINLGTFIQSEVEYRKLYQDFWYKVLPCLSGVLKSLAVRSTLGPRGFGWSEFYIELPYHDSTFTRHLEALQELTVEFAYKSGAVTSVLCFLQPLQTLKRVVLHVRSIESKLSRHSVGLPIKETIMNEVINDDEASGPVQSVLLDVIPYRQDFPGRINSDTMVFSGRNQKWQLLRGESQNW